jgi:hypothetical protein
MAIAVEKTDAKFYSDISVQTVALSAAQTPHLPDIV